MYSVLNTLSEYTQFFISKALLHTFFYLFLKSLKAFSVSLRLCKILNSKMTYLDYIADVHKDIL